MRNVCTNTITDKNLNQIVWTLSGVHPWGRLLSVVTPRCPAHSTAEGWDQRQVGQTEDKKWSEVKLLWWFNYPGEKLIRTSCWLFHLSVHCLINASLESNPCSRTTDIVFLFPAHLPTFPTMQQDCWQSGQRFRWVIDTASIKEIVIASSRWGRKQTVCCSAVKLLCGFLYLE